MRRTSRNGVYKLAAESLDPLTKMGYFPLSPETAHDTCADESSKESDIEEDEKLDLLQHGFFEVDDIIDRRINSKTHEYEYRVRFRGYAESDDVWLPASSFNRPVDFSSSSRYGRKRFHKTNVDEAHNPLPGVEKVKSSRNGEGVKQPRERPRTKRVHRDTRAHPEIESKSRVKPVAEVAPCASPKDDTNIPSTIMPDAPLPSDVCILSSESDDDPKSPIHSLTNTSTSRLQADLLKSTGRFSSPRMAIASYPTPPVQICNTFRLFLLNGSNIAFADPFAVDWLPAERVLNRASKSLHAEENSDACAVEFDGLGHFNVQSLRVLQNYFAFKAVAKKALFEEKWLLEETHGVSPSERLHLLNTVLYLSPKSGLVSVDDLTTLCGERYLNDKVIDYLLNLFEERANSAAGKPFACHCLHSFHQRKWAKEP